MLLGGHWFLFLYFFFFETHLASSHRRGGLWVGLPPNHLLFWEKYQKYDIQSSFSLRASNPRIIAARTLRRESISIRRLNPWSAPARRWIASQGVVGEVEGEGAGPSMINEWNQLSFINEQFSVASTFSPQVSIILGFRFQLTPLPPVLITVLQQYDG